jgi:hypothetical protein
LRIRGSGRAVEPFFQKLGGSVGGSVGGLADLPFVALLLTLGVKKMSEHTPLPRIDEETERQLLAVVENDHVLRIICMYSEAEQLQVVGQCRDGVVTGWMLERDVSKPYAIRILQDLRDGEELQDESIAIFMRSDLEADYKRLN